MGSRFTNRYRSFCDSLEGLKKARERDSSDEFVLSGTVQKFNLTFDIAWKLMKDICVQHYKVLDFAAGSPRETLRVAASVRLISDDRWMNMLDHRNRLAHDYDGSLAEECFKTIIDEYIPLFEQLADNAVLKGCFKTSGKDAGATY